ncbi:hypothetical protein AAKU55_004389 [Oxalobacteraceae bacterium GrIS 1.11]
MSHIDYRLGQAGYVSELTQFIDQCLDEHPEVLENQHGGWYIYRDHLIDLKLRELAERDSIPPPPYSYE